MPTRQKSNLIGFLLLEHFYFEKVKMLNRREGCGPGPKKQIGTQAS